jgi:hypothetical protein
MNMTYIYRIPHWDNAGNPLEFIEQPDGSFLDAYNERIVTREWAQRMAEAHHGQVILNIVETSETYDKQIKWIDHGKGRAAGYYKTVLILRELEPGANHETFAVASPTNEPYGNTPIVKAKYGDGYYYVFGSLVTAVLFIERRAQTKLLKRGEG